MHFVWGVGGVLVDEFDVKGVYILFVSIVNIYCILIVGCSFEYRLTDGLSLFTRFFAWAGFTPGRNDSIV